VIDWFRNSLGYSYAVEKNGLPADWLLDLVSIGFHNSLYSYGFKSLDEVKDASEKFCAQLVLPSPALSPSKKNLSFDGTVTCRSSKQRALCPVCERLFLPFCLVLVCLSFCSSICPSFASGQVSVVCIFLDFDLFINNAFLWLLFFIIFPISCPNDPTLKSFLTPSHVLARARACMLRASMWDPVFFMRVGRRAVMVLGGCKR
jgi:hypothetical protein